MKNKDGFYKLDIQMFAGTEFVVDDVLPATTQLKIAWTNNTAIIDALYTPQDVVSLVSSVIYFNQEGPMGDAYIFTIFDTDIASDIASIGPSFYSTYETDKYVIVSTDGWTEQQRKITQVSAMADTIDLTYEDLNASSTWTVSFDSNGGSAVSDIEDVEDGATISAPTAPTRTNYTFVGWYKEEALTNAWSFSSDTVTADTTLYAKWEITQGGKLYLTIKHLHDNKVDKVTGKVLSDENYTTTEKNKLAGIDESANNYSLPVASTTRGGVKADAKDSGDTVEVKIDSSTGKLYVPTYPTDTGEDNVIEGVIVDSTELTPDGAKNVTIPDATTTVKGVTKLSDAASNEDLGSTNDVITEQVALATLIQSVQGNKKIWIGDQATYDALTPDENTVYFVTGTVADYIESIFIDEVELTVTDGVVTIPIANTTDTDGAMSHEMAAKLASVAENANNYTHPTDGADVTITASDGKVLSSVTVDASGHVTAVSSKTLAEADIPNLSQSKITDLEDDLADKAEKYPATNTEDANYTLVLADDGKLILAGHATNAVKITIPLNSSVAFPTNTEIRIYKYADGTLTIGTADGATLRGSSYTTTFEINDSVTIKKVGTDAWIMMGDYSEVV